MRIFENVPQKIWGSFRMLFMRLRKYIIGCSIGVFIGIAMVAMLFDLDTTVNDSEIILTGVWMSIAVVITATLTGLSYWSFRYFTQAARQKLFFRTAGLAVATLFLWMGLAYALNLFSGSRWLFTRPDFVPEGNLYNGGPLGAVMLLFVGLFIAAWLWGVIPMPNIERRPKVSKPKKPRVNSAKEPVAAYAATTHTPTATYLQDMPFQSTSDEQDQKVPEWTASIRNFS